MTEFAFDLMLRAAIRVNAATEYEARNMLAEALDCAYTNFGAWPNGDPILGEVSLDTENDRPELFEVDGEQPEADKPHFGPPTDLEMMFQRMEAALFIETVSVAEHLARLDEDIVTSHKWTETSNDSTAAITINKIKQGDN